MKELLEMLRKAEEKNQEEIDKERKERMKGLIDKEDRAIIVTTTNGQAIIGEKKDIFTLFTMIARTLIHEDDIDKEELLKLIELASLNNEELMKKTKETMKENLEEIKKFVEELEEDE